MNDNNINNYSNKYLEINVSKHVRNIFIIISFHLNE